MRAPFAQSALPLPEQLAQLQDAYRRANSFVRFENCNDFDEMREQARNLPSATRDAWARLWQDVADKHGSLSLPKAYYELLDEAHRATWAGLAKILPANARALNFEDRLTFMQQTADAQTAFWQQEFPAVFSGFHGTRVLTADSPSKQYSLVASSQDGLYEYGVADIQERFDVWTHVSGHEPQHSVQQHLIKALDAGENLPEPLEQAALIFAFYAGDGAGNLQPSIVCGDDGRPYDNLGHQVGRTYVLSLIEQPAHYQGGHMEKAMEKNYPSPPRLSSQNKI